MVEPARPVQLLLEVLSSSSQWKVAAFMIDNRYCNQDIQKAFMSGVTGCIDHYGKLVNIIAEA